MMVKADRNNKIVKCSIVGDGLVGKTTIVRKFANHKTNESYVATVFDNFAGNVAMNGNKYTVSVFDTAGQQDYEGLRVFTYAQSDVIIVCYSVVDRESFNNVSEFWIPEIRSYIGKDRPIILVATQTDLELQADCDVNSVVTRKEGSQLASKIGARLFMESSVHDSESVTKLFENVVALKQKYRKTSFIEKILRR